MGAKTLFFENNFRSGLNGQLLVYIYCAFIVYGRKSPNIVWVLYFIHLLKDSCFGGDAVTTSSVSEVLCFLADEAASGYVLLNTCFFLKTGLELFLDKSFLAVSRQG